MQGLAHELDVGTLEVAERGHREVALGAVDDLGRQHAPRGLLEHALAVMGELERRRARGRELDEVVVEERRARLQAEGHRHVVHALDRVVDEHHLGVQAQRPIHGPIGARAREVLGGEVPAGVLVEPPAIAEQRRRARRAGGRRTPARRPRGRRRRPAAAAGTRSSRARISSAPCPHCTTFTCWETSSESRWKATQSWETIGSLMARHRLVQGRQQAIVVDPDLVVVGLEARLPPGRSSANSSPSRPPAAGNPTLKVCKAPLARLREQRDDQARVQAAREQDPHRDVGHHATIDRHAQRLEHGVLPIRRRPVRPRRIAREGRVPVHRCCDAVPSGSTISTVAGGSLRTPARIVRGAGTTECQLR